MEANTLHPLSVFKKVILEKWLSPEQLLKLIDVDEDGQISKDEFIGLTKTFSLASDSEELIETIFSTFDHNNDGFIDLSEFTTALSGSPFTVEEMVVSSGHVNGNVDFSNSSKFVSLVAHNEMKEVLINFVADNADFFSALPLVTTGTTGRSLKRKLGICVEKLVASGPLGGDQAIGGLISEGRISAIFFFKDPLSSHAHASDIEALTRLCDVHQIPYATNPASAKGLMMSLSDLGLNWAIHQQDSPIVQKYKEKQQNVVNSHTNN